MSPFLWHKTILTEAVVVCSYVMCLTKYWFWLVNIISVVAAEGFMDGGHRNRRVTCLNLGSQPICCSCSRFLASFKWASPAPGDDVFRGLWELFLGLPRLPAQALYSGPISRQRCGTVTMMVRGEGAYITRGSMVTLYRLQQGDVPRHGPGNLYSTVFFKYHPFIINVLKWQQQLHSKATDYQFALKHSAARSGATVACRF